MSESAHRGKITTMCFLLVTLNAAALALPSSADNAALLYYQAMLVKPERDINTIILIKEVLSGTEPNETIRAYLKKCDRTLTLVEPATEIENCNWGMIYSPDWVSEIGLSFRFDELRDIIGLYAVTLCADKEFRQSLTWSLKMLKISRHIGNFTIASNTWSLSFEDVALVCIKRVLESTTPDAETLIWLQDQLEMLRPSRDITKMMKNECDLSVQLVRNNPGSVKLWREKLTEKAKYIDTISQAFNERLDTLTRNKKSIQEYHEMLSLPDKDIKASLRLDDDEVNEFRYSLTMIEQIKDFSKMMPMTDEEFSKYTLPLYDKWLNSSIRILQSDIPYKQKCVEIEKIYQDARTQYVFDFEAASLNPFNPIGIYNSQMSREASYNIFRAAVEIYLIKAKTGQLPAVLPKDLPGDTFSEQEFEYNITNNGFELRCREKATYEMNVRKCEFAVKNQN